MDNIYSGNSTYFKGE